MVYIKSANVNIEQSTSTATKQLMVVVGQYFKGELMAAYFFRDWENYMNGCGQLQNEFWLGNENIFTICCQGLSPKGNELRIDMINKQNVKKYTKCDYFNIGNIVTRYQLSIKGFTGTVFPDALHFHNRKKFSTYGNDNDEENGNCARKFFAGWWFNPAC